MGWGQHLNISRWCVKLCNQLDLVLLCNCRLQLMIGAQGKFCVERCFSSLQLSSCPYLLKKLSPDDKYNQEFQFFLHKKKPDYALSFGSFAGIWACVEFSVLKC